MRPSGKIYTCIQGTQEWFLARLGKATSSRFKDIIAKTKSGYSASRDNYMYELLTERLTGTRSEGYTTKAMEWGTEQEVFARGAYESIKGVFVDEVGFVDHPTIQNCGGSPDGLIGTDGQLEIKCPETKQHLKYFEGYIPRDYKIQMTGAMMCTGRDWCDFVSYDPRLPDKLMISIVRYKFDKVLAGEIEAELGDFLSELDRLGEKYMALIEKKIDKHV